jgi:hypothetical protein
MQKITEEAFQALINESGWQFSDDFNYDSSFDKNEHAGYVRRDAILGDGDLMIHYAEDFYFNEYNEDSFESAPCCEGAEALHFSGFVVVDEDGDEIEPRAFLDSMPQIFLEIDYEKELPKLAIDDIDNDKDNTMDTITVKIDDAPDIRFKGELTASVTSDVNATRWTELSLYKTVGEKYICHSIGYSRHEGEQTRYSGKVCETTDEVIAFFGHRWLSKELYEGAGISDAIDVE